MSRKWWEWARVSQKCDVMRCVRKLAQRNKLLRGARGTGGKGARQEPELSHKLCSTPRNFMEMCSVLKKSLPSPKYHTWQCMRSKCFPDDIKSVFQVFQRHSYFLANLINFLSSLAFCLHYLNCQEDNILTQWQAIKMLRAVLEKHKWNWSSPHWNKFQNTSWI